MPSRDVNAATRLAEASWMRDKFAWDQSTCQKRIESDKIRNEKIIAHSGTRTHNLEICSAVLYRPS